MTRDYVKTAIAEAERFLERAKPLLCLHAVNDYADRCEPGPEQSATRRASLR